MQKNLPVSLIVVFLVSLVVLYGCKTGESDTTGQAGIVDLPLYNVSEDNTTQPLPNITEESEEEDAVTDIDTGNDSDIEAQLNQSELETDEEGLTTDETAGEVDETGEEAEDEDSDGVDIIIIAQKIEWLDPANPNNDRLIESNRSLFSDVTCAIGTSAEDSGFQGNTQSDDLITFTFTNENSNEFYLPIEKPEDSPTSEGMKLMINARRIRDAAEKCGSNYVKGNASMTCEGVRTVLKSGTSVQGQEMRNKLEANTRYYRTELLFTC